MVVSLLAFQMQQLELAQIRQREANLTALAAIGPRKKRKMDSPVQGASAEVKNCWRGDGEALGHKKHFFLYFFTSFSVLDSAIILKAMSGGLFW